MPAQKRCFQDNLDDDDDEQLHLPLKQSRSEDESQLPSQPLENNSPVKETHQQADEDEDEDEDEEEVKPQVDEEDDDDDDKDDDDDEDEEDKTKDSDESPSSSSHPKPEFVFVELPEIRKDVQCPICLGIIKKTRTVMECLHRFCRECIDKSMRMGNNECPACRTHCASRRSLRDDPNYDALIAILYPDIEKYEEEELAFHEEERTRNKQIQASIAQILQRQSEALIKRRGTPGKDTPDTFMTRSQRNHRNSYSRRRSSRNVEFQGLEDNEDGNDNNVEKDESSNDERHKEIRHRRRRRRAGTRSSQPSSSVANSEGYPENDLEISRENQGISPSLVLNSEILAWGRGGARSHTRHGNGGCNTKSSRNTRLSKLVDYLRSLEENNDELDVHLVLIALDRQSTPSLQQPHLCCRPSLSVKYLCEYVARQTPLKVEEVELLALKGEHLYKDNKTTVNPSYSTTDLVSLVIDPCRDELQVLGAEETLAGIKANCTSSRDHLILVYRRKGGR